MHNSPVERTQRETALGGLLALIARGASAAFVIQSTGLVLKYISQVLLARWIGSVDEYAAFAVAFTWTQLLAVGAALGFTVASLRFIPQYLTSGDTARLRGFLRRSRQLVVLAGILIAAVGTAALAFSAGRQDQVDALRIALWLVPLYAIAELQMQMLRGTRRIAIAFFPSFILQPLLLIGVAFAWWKLQGGLQADSAAWSLVAAVGAVVAIQQFGLSRAIPDLPTGESPIDNTRLWVSVAIPLFLSAGFLMLMGNSDVILLGMLGNDGDAGVYFAASRTARQAAFMLAAVNAIVAPLISGQGALDNRARLERISHIAAALVFFPSLLVAVVLLVFRHWVLGLFGDEYVAGQTALSVLVIGQLINAVTGPVGLLLSLGGHERRSTTVYGCCALFNVLLNCICIPRFGMTGAAVATSSSLIVANVWLAILVVKHMGIMPIPLLPRSRLKT